MMILKSGRRRCTFLSRPSSTSVARERSCASSTITTLYLRVVQVSRRYNIAVQVNRAVQVSRPSTHRGSSGSRSSSGSSSSTTTTTTHAPLEQRVLHHFPLLTCHLSPPPPPSHPTHPIYYITQPTHPPLQQRILHHFPQQHAVCAEADLGHALFWGRRKTCACCVNKRVRLLRNVSGGADADLSHTPCQAGRQASEQSPICCRSMESGGCSPTKHTPAQQHKSALWLPTSTHRGRHVLKSNGIAHLRAAAVGWGGAEGCSRRVGRRAAPAPPTLPQKRRGECTRQLSITALNAHLSPSSPVLTS